MKIEIKNDGKGKYQSCEAILKIQSDDNLFGSYNAEFVGYGENEQEATKNLISQINRLIENLNNNQIK